MYCVKCGKQINDDINFCPYCGNRITNKVSDRVNKNKINIIFLNYLSDINNTLVLSTGTNGGFTEVNLLDNKKYQEKVRVNFLIGLNEKIILIYDNTIFGSGKSGIVITDNYICINTGTLLKKFDFNQFLKLDIYNDKHTIYFDRLRLTSSMNEIYCITEFLVSLQNGLRD